MIQNNILIDTHTHLDDKKYQNDIDEVLQRAYKNNIKYFIIPGADIYDLKRAVALSNLYDNIYFSVGVHPYNIKDLDIAYLKKFITHKKCVGVGECGLDYYRLPENKDEALKEKELQKQVFIAQIELAIEFDLPLIVHIREASKDSFEILKSYHNKVRGVLHCFNASEMLLGLQENFYYGIGGVVTFKNAKKLIETLPKLKRDRILFETDSPYLAPHPHRGKRNEPSFIPFISSKISETLDIQTSKLENIVLQNTKRLFTKLEINE